MEHGAWRGEFIETRSVTGSNAGFAADEKRNNGGIETVGSG